MAGGNFDINVGKERPGTYVNVKANKQQKPKGSVRGIAVVPLIGYDWGPNGEFVKLSVDSPDAAIHKLGRSIYDDNEHMLLVREIFKNAITCFVYIINPGVVAKATGGDGLTITAAYPGARGNAIKVSCATNIRGSFDVTVYLGTDIVEVYENLKTAKDLIAASNKRYVVFTSTTPDKALTAFASLSLSGGTNGTSDNAAVMKFLDKVEGIRFHTMCLPTDESTIQTACIEKIMMLRTEAGRWTQAVMPNCSTADNEGIINVTNAVILEFGEETKTLSVAQTCAWVAGATAAASKVESLTYHEYDGAISIVGEKTNEEAKLAIQKGEFFFSMSDSGTVVVEYDINTLHTFTSEKTADYAKNRIIRVYDSFSEDLALTFPPNKFDNESDAWLIMEGLGRALLQQYDDAGAIKDVDLENDFYVDQSRSMGDVTYFNVGIQAVDSSEKLYFSVSTK